MHLLDVFTKVLLSLHEADALCVVATMLALPVTNMAAATAKPINLFFIVFFIVIYPIRVGRNL